MKNKHRTYCLESIRKAKKRARQSYMDRVLRPKLIKEREELRRYQILMNWIGNGKPIPTWCVEVKL